MPRCYWALPSCWLNVTVTRQLGKYLERDAMILAISFLAAAFLAGAAIGIITVITIGVRRDDRAKTLTDPPRTHIEAATRRMLGVGMRDSHADSGGYPEKSEPAMHSFKTGEAQRYCRCGALCEAMTARCRKCRYRARWNRRKAWRCNPATSANRNSHGKK